MDVIEQVEGLARSIKVGELAELLSMSPKALYKAIEDGKLPTFRIGSSVMLNPAVTARCLRQRVG